jgi:hypothetical protein
MKSFIYQSKAYPKEFMVKYVNYQQEVLKSCTGSFLFLSSIMSLRQKTEEQNWLFFSL